MRGLVIFQALARCLLRTLTTSRPCRRRYSRGGTGERIGRGGGRRRVGTYHGAEAVFGCSFDAFFCEAPTYLQYLYDLLIGLGGTVCIESSEQRLNSYLDGEHTYIVNCCGLGSYQFLEEAYRLDAPGDGYKP